MLNFNPGVITCGGISVGRRQEHGCNGGEGQHKQSKAGHV